MPQKPPLRLALDARAGLLAYLHGLGLIHATCSVKLSDEGFGLVVNAPTNTHSQVPEEFQGFRVMVADPV